MNRTFTIAWGIAAIGLILVIYLWMTPEETENVKEPDQAAAGGNGQRAGFSSEEAIPARAVRRKIDEEARRFRKEWGIKMNPAGDCVFTLVGDVLKITVPGSDIPHDLNPETNTAGSDNAPLVLQPVEGDFVVQVKMHGVSDPGEESTMPGFSGYVGAGLVVFADARNFVRLERATLRRPGSDPVPYTNFEIRIDGVTQRFGSTDDLPTEGDRPTWLRIERKGDMMHGSMSQDGETWITTEPKTLPPEIWDKGGIQAGIAAISTSRYVFEPEYSEFSIAQGTETADD
ncbi:MAG: DUF1349 domain-containing protein [Verrucomicrobiota bacterium]